MTGRMGANYLTASAYSEGVTPPDTQRGNDERAIPKEWPLILAARITALPTMAPFLPDSSLDAPDTHRGRSAFVLS